MLDKYDVVRKPIVTEKSTMASETGAIVFEVNMNATKLQVKEAIENLFNVKVKAVNTLISKGKVKRTSVKEIKFRPSTDTGDYNIKLKKIKSFILDGDKTKISVRFRGREILNSNMGLGLLNKLKDELEDIAQVDQEPSLEGKQLLMVLSPLKGSNRKKI